jgi:hypothetical protein
VKAHSPRRQSPSRLRLHIADEIRQRGEDVLVRLMLRYHSCRNIGGAAGGQHSLVVRAEVLLLAVQKADGELRVPVQVLMIWFIELS